MAEHSGHLLIVDDNKVNRQLMARSVELLGHRAALAENGQIAMRMLEEGSYDVLLLDIETPEMDGFEVLEALKRHAILRDFPVIVTASVERSGPVYMRSPARLSARHPSAVHRLLAM